MTGKGLLETALVEVLPVSVSIPLFQCQERTKDKCPCVPKDHISLAGVFKAFVWDAWGSDSPSHQWVLTQEPLTQLFQAQRSASQGRRSALSQSVIS